MAANVKKSIVFTAIGIGLLGIVTGLFLGGDLLPSQGKGQLYDVRETIATTTTTMVDNLGEHISTQTVKTTQKVPRGYPFTIVTGGGGNAAGGNTQGVGVVQGPYEVWVHDQDFGPSLLTVPVGTTVTWVSKSFETHTITSAEGLFDIGVDIGASVSYTFTKPGVYEYRCTPHPEMVGSVTVK
jgi:plastocyanin